MLFFMVKINPNISNGISTYQPQMLSRAIMSYNRYGMMGVGEVIKPRPFDGGDVKRDSQTNRKL
ncbi:hypothetical protein N39L_19950 [Limnospira platensis NIES-39]|jgi:hypothetical protein|uniref:Uncharacterized protein n=2 Tax=Sirenicapillariaceae TaxID=2934961 RepID=A0A5M3TAG0_LIMPL|nr:hypothetical protein AP285_09155 [Arthrospira platensis YZ]BDT12272.1 hypothetical protein N39L_19950 [Arthrospira platensis NIES-39]GCE94399.1 hypothetical protein NIES46_24540 [Arthrospira platensis NIES-46]